MFGLETELSPKKARREARRQLAIAESIAQQREEEAERVRALTVENARRRQQMWADQEREREERRMAAAAEEARREAEKRDRQQEQQAAIDQAKMREFKDAEAGVKAIAREIDLLRRQPTDLSTPEGVHLAGERAGQIKGLEAALAQADSRLLQAERLIGRHRPGRA